MSTPTTSAGTHRTERSGSDNLLWVMRSEWTKLWSLRSTPWTIVAMFVVTVGFAALASWGTATHLREAAAGGALDVTNVALAGLLFGQLPIAVLGVLVISGEYSTGGIRSSLTAVPGRIRLLTAKAVVFTLVAVVSGLITSFVSFYVGMIFFNAHGVGVGIGEPHVLRAVIGGGLLLTASGLLGFAIGILLRHSAGAITVSVALLFVIPIVLSAIPADVVRSANKYFLSSAGERVTHVVSQPDALGPWHGYLVFIGEVAFLLVCGAVLMVRRDA